MPTRLPVRHHAPLARQRRLESRVALALGAATTMLWLLGRSSPPSDALAQTSFELPSGGGFGWPVPAILLAIVLNAGFLAAETALDLLRPVHLKLVKENGSARHLQELMDERARLVAACTFGSQLCRIAMYMLGLVPALGIVPWLAEQTSLTGYSAVLVATSIVWLPIFLLNLILGELAPKSFASHHPHRVALFLRRFVLVFAVLFSAPAALVAGVAGLLTARFGAHAANGAAGQAEEEIKTLVESAEESGEIEADEKELLHSVFEFTDRIAREVMTPRVDMDAAPVGGDPAYLIGLIERTGHSRIPVYEETDDQIIGIVHAKDLLLASVQAGASRPTAKIDLRALMHPALFVPENKNLHELLAEMRAARSQMAVIQDEFGGTAGIVTIEDIVEELVGEIQDEYDVEEPEIIEDAGAFVVGGKARMDDLGEALGSPLASEEFDTVGGYVFGLFGRQPKEGECVVADGYRFAVTATDGRRILRMRVEKAPESEIEAAE